RSRGSGAKWFPSMNWFDQNGGSSECLEVDSSRLAEALEGYQEALRRGQPVDRAAFLSEHADVALKLAECLDALELIQAVTGAVAPAGGSAGNPSPLELGDILGEFCILREIGRGGMGVVYEAEQLGLPERRVALKVLPGAAALDACTFQRFRIETQAAACLNHPNIVPVFAVGCERGIPYYAMPLVEGRSLAEMIGCVRSEHSSVARAVSSLGMKHEPGGTWPAIVARLGLQAAEALAHAHSLGVIHRDIKPSNLIVQHSGRLWVTDFGLARIDSDDTRLTRTVDLVRT